MNFVYLQASPPGHVKFVEFANLGRGSFPAADSYLLCLLATILLISLSGT